MSSTPLASAADIDRALFDHATIACVSLDAQGVVLRVNPAFTILSGYTATDVVGRPGIDLMAEASDRVTYQEALSRAAADDVWEGEFRGRRRDGSAPWMRTTTQALRAADGRLLGFLNLLLDVSEIRRAEQTLRETERRLAAVIDAATDAIILSQPDGTIVLLNPAAERMLRTTAAEVVGTSGERFMTPAALAVHRRDVERLLADPSPIASMFAPAGLIARRADGEEFPYEATVARTLVDGQPLILNITRDVQARQEAEAERRRLEQQATYLREEIETAHDFAHVIGRSPALLAALAQVGRVAETDATVLILGETGTGKEIFARAIHARSRRATQPLVKVNCAALPAGLVESELFGHEKGAFTGATTRRVGRFELAHRGTIFLDEIGELPLDLQSKLLRVLQEQEFERLGSGVTQRVDVRVIAATNRDLLRLVEEGRFRADLYYRLHVFPLSLPPLRDRPDDVPLLAADFVRRYASKVGRPDLPIDPAALTRLRTYPWPGNVRELENVIERAVILANGPTLDVPPEMLPTPLAPPSAPVSAAHAEPIGAAAPLGDRLLSGVEADHIRATLERHGWRIEGAAGAAQALGLAPSTLRSRMQRLGIGRR